ncbi:cysteine-rich RLK (RECEPTOR-like protein kinase) 8 [Striga hermonthica]|uniref:Cysteine-rich RLK (RECEPTOR-like protein kinase) 8 n=1 Tax=Striga hermonthica TaxID=68872 RepID=A0A9N7NAL3_STRHE|nr:cysteine-rich RLK (RECEPTOR-like protein kinase) 8 [Striga hermonthica]
MLVGYVDSDTTGDVDSRTSISGFLMTFAGGDVSWQSKLQKCVALSTTEAEYIAITEGCKKALWMRRFLEELGLHQKKYLVFSDSQSAIHLSKNFSFHSSENGADMMTKTS